MNHFKFNEDQNNSKGFAQKLKKEIYGKLCSF